MKYQLKLKTINIILIFFLISSYSCVPISYVEKQRELELQLTKKNSKISALENHLKQQNQKIQNLEKIALQNKIKFNEQLKVSSNTTTNIVSNSNLDNKETPIVNSLHKKGVYVITTDQQTGQKKKIPLYRKSYAVIIGIDQYKNLSYDMQLSYAVKDAKGVEDVIKKHFCFDKIYTLYNENATKENIINLLSGNLTNTSDQDSIFIFWSGHGYTEKTTIGGRLGYLIPYDGTFEVKKLHKNISMTLIKEDISKRIPAKHIFYVMDSCYSGLLAAKRGAPRKSNRDIDYLKEITNETSRQVLTAGSVNQQVLDGGPMGHSVFTGRFIELLKKTNDYITAHEISTYVKEKVFSDAKARNHKQTPTYGELFGLGDYVFIPSITKKVDNITDDIKKYQKELQKLNDLEIATKEANDERIRRHAELQKREIQAKLKAEKLKHQRISKVQEEMKQREAERKKKEHELIEAEKQRKLQLAFLKQQVEDKRKSLGAVSYNSLSPSATVKDMQEIDSKIFNIKEKFRKLLAESIEMISKQVNDAFEKANKEVKSEFESQADFEDRVKLLKDKASKKQRNRFNEAKTKIEQEYNTEIEPFINALKKLSAQEFHISYKDLKLEIGIYNGEFDVYPVSIKSLKTYNGVMLACSANIPIPRQEAKIFKQHFQNNILRAEIKGNFQSTNFFRITRAYVIDDAINKKYDLFLSKFLDLGNGIVYDCATQLLWLKDASYIKPHNGCLLYQDKDVEFAWKDAIRKTEELVFAGLCGWRLPEESELERMFPVYHKQELSPFINIRKSYIVLESPNYAVDLQYRKAGSCGSGISADFAIWPVRGSK